MAYLAQIGARHSKGYDGSSHATINPKEGGHDQVPTMRATHRRNLHGRNHGQSEPPASVEMHRVHLPSLFNADIGANESPGSENRHPERRAVASCCSTKALRQDALGGLLARFISLRRKAISCGNRVNFWSPASSTTRPSGNTVMEWGRSAMVGLRLGGLSGGALADRLGPDEVPVIGAKVA